MKYIVYFYVDHEVVEVPEDDIILGDFSSWTLREWSNSKGLEHKVKVFYEGNVFEACVLQVYVHVLNTFVIS